MVTTAFSDSPQGTRVHLPDAIALADAADGRVVRDISFVSGGLSAHGSTAAAMAASALGPDHRLTTDRAIHRGPSLVADDLGVLHLIWERRTRESSTIEYTTSSGSGSTWRDPQPLIDDSGGAPREAAIAILDRRLLVSWADNDGGHVGVWQLP